MNNTQKILIAIGVGVGAAYIYNRFNKDKRGATKLIPENQNLQLPENAAISDLTREEKEEFILDNISATPQEVASGFEGTRFVWNPQMGRMYPAGTIKEGKTPAYVDYVFSSADATNVNSTSSSIPNAVENACMTLKELNDQEIELIFQVVKKQQENPSIQNEEEALKEMGVTNENIFKVFRNKLKKRINDIKILKKDENWNFGWNKKKNMRIKRRNDFKEKMGFDKSIFDKEVAKVCGRKPKVGRKAEYKKCVQMVANKLRSEIKDSVRNELDNAPVSVKEDISKNRQKSFARQITTRRSGGMFAGRRWDGESNDYIESLVDNGLV
jgi:hypothetical protein